MKIMEHDGFDAFFAERARAAEAYVKGNGGLLDTLVAHQGDATFFSPQGDVATGAETVARGYLNDAKAFRPNGTTRFDHMKTRVTEIFRKIDGVWKLVHRHADMGRTPE
jgi:ketosteroid isomerase-like protein